MTSLGTVLGGSLKAGLQVKLAPEVAVEEVRVGSYAVIEGRHQLFFGMITDISLEAINPRLRITPPDLSDPFIAQVLSGHALFGQLTVVPYLALGQEAIRGIDAPQPVRTVPAHFSPVRAATEADVALIFGQEDERHYQVGTPLDMEVKVCLDLPTLAMRSNGVFGKTGTGKTFLTRLLLVGLLQKSGAISLIFDMHNEYGWSGSSESGYPVKGLKQLFPSRVTVFTLDEESSRRRGVSTDFTVEIGYDEVDPEDVVNLRETLNLTPLAVDAVFRLARHFGPSWLERFIELDSDGLRNLVEAFGEHGGTLSGLRRGLEGLRRFPFLVSKARDNSVRRIMEELNRGKNVVLEFGRYQSDATAQVLVANLLTRRIHDEYVKKSEAAQGDQRQEPQRLVIVIEEAHKFLSPQMAAQTAFGVIAREMRKSNVTLLVIDQRPAGIDPEVMSQLGTKFCCLLDNERDVEAVLSGMAGRGELRSVLASLESKQQALIFGHALPMPVAVRVRPYDETFYGEVGFATAAELQRRGQQDIDELWGD